MRFVEVIMMLALSSATVLAQQSVPPTPQPASDKPAENGPSLEETLKLIQDKVNQQGSIVYVESASNTLTGEKIPSIQNSVESKVVAVDPAGGLFLQNSIKSSAQGDTMNQTASVGIKHIFEDRQVTTNQTFNWRVYFKDIEKLEVLSATDYKHRANPAMTYQEQPSFFELVVHLAAEKTDQQPMTVTAGKNVGEFALHFHNKETADRVAKAMIHAIKLCSGGS